MTGMFIVSHIRTQYSEAYICYFDRNNNRQAEIKELTAKGIIPHDEELKKHVMEVQAEAYKVRCAERRGPGWLTGAPGRSISIRSSGGSGSRSEYTQ